LIFVLRACLQLNHQSLKISSLVASRITKLPYIGQPDYMEVKKYEVMTELISTDTPLHASDHVPWWVVVLSACVGAAILILLVFLLWKVSAKLSTFIYRLVHSRARVPRVQGMKYVVRGRRNPSQRERKCDAITFFSPFLPQWRRCDLSQ
jgi:hypothetical protein